MVMETDSAGDQLPLWAKRSGRFRHRAAAKAAIEAHRDAGRLGPDAESLVAQWRDLAIALDELDAASPAYHRCLRSLLEVQRAADALPKPAKTDATGDALDAMLADLTQ